MFFVCIQNLLFFPTFLICISISGIHAVQLILVNNCPYNIWPGFLATSGHPTPVNGGLHLGPYSEQYFQLPYGWSGRIWARTGCCFDSHNHGQCQTGDCNNQLHCNGVPGTPPATLIEMTFGTSKSPLHFYDVSLVDGFNVPVSMGPVEGKPGCGVAGCKVDLNVCCPSRFEVRREGRVVACESACAALKTDKYCCKGGYGSPGTCGPTLFSKLAKAACPDAYSYAFDDESSLKSCVAKRYLITFCPAKE